MSRRPCLVAALLLLLGACAGPREQTAADDADERLRALYERAWAWRQGENGRRRSAAGAWEADDRWPRVDAASQARRLAYWQDVLAELDTIPRQALSPEERINAAVFREIIQGLAGTVRYRSYEAPLNSDTFFWTRLHPRGSGFDDIDGYRRYLARLRDIPRLFDEHIANMRSVLARGFTPPAVTLRGRDASVEAYLVVGPENPFHGPLRHFPAGMDAAARGAVEREVAAALEEAVIPAYRRLLAFLREEYLPGARRTLAARDLPDGEAFYRAQIRRYTTLDLAPREIHDTGLREVARIRAAMEAILEELEYPGSMAEFFAFLRSDPQFYAQTPEQLLGVSAYTAKRMDAHLDEVLGFLPRRRFTIAPVPAEIAPVYTAGRGGLERCLMNTWNLPARPLYTIPALTLHECAPGHALQAAIALEAPGDIPEFRARNYFSGYGEGWGLYTEWLGGELGIYRTPYERFGQLSYEMWRACRLVIDTGVHYFGWSRERAIAYLADHAALSRHEVTTEVDRYISWPAQALAYKLGELLIRDKRAQAEAALGPDFDPRHFHDRILALRSVPLEVLSQQLDQWIAAGGPDPYAGSAGD